MKVYLKTLAALTASLAIASVAVGQQVTLQMQTADFADVSGDLAPDGSLWVLVVNPTGDFGVDTWGPRGPIDTRAAQPNTFMAAADGSDSDFVAWAGNISSGLFDSARIGTAGPIDTGTANVAEGDRWGVAWFPGLMVGDSIEGGQSYGFFTDDSLTIPSPGTHDFSDVFAGATRTADYTVVPEPSTYAAIFGFGVLLFVFLRRRFRK